MPVALLALCAAASCGRAEPHCRVFVAASMADVVGQVAAERGFDIALQPAASSTLAQQILSGAAADVFVSAHADWMDRLERRGLLLPGTRRALAGNGLVLVAPRGRGRPLDVRPGFDLAGAFQGRLAIGDPDHVPAGRYAREALSALSVWDSVRDRLAPAADARGALALVERGEVELGIVYATDAVAGAVDVVARLEASAAPAVRYEVALLAGPGPARTAGRAFYDALLSPAGRALFERAGFAPPPNGPAISAVAGAAQPPAPDGGGFLSPGELGALWLSLKVGLAATLGGLLPAAALALWLARTTSRARVLVEALVLLPMVLPPVVVGYLLLLSFGREGVVGQALYALFGVRLPFSWLGAALAAMVLGLPLMIRAMRQAFEAVDPGLEEAAATLGAGRLSVLLSVTLPLAARGAVAGAALCFARSLGEFGATITFAGNIEGSTRTLPLAIWSALQSARTEPAAWRLTWVCIALSLATTLCSEWLVRRPARAGAA